MALPPNLALLALGKASVPHTLELWLDYLCPFSAKQLLGVEQHVFPLVFGSGAKYAGRVRLVIRPVPQPWHGTSTYLHEAALSSTRLAPPPKASDDASVDNPTSNAFWRVSLTLMRAQTRFFDVPAKDKTAEQIRDELAGIVSEALSSSSSSSSAVKASREDVRALLAPQGDGNAGSPLVPDLKYCVKLGRQTGVHVTPSVSLNGLLVSDVSSSFGANEWAEWLDKNVGGEEEEAKF